MQEGGKRFNGHDPYNQKLRIEITVQLANIY